MYETTIVALAAGRQRATALVARFGNPAELRLEVVGPAGEVVADRTIADWRRTPIRSRPGPYDHLNWAKPRIDGLRPGTRYQLRLIDHRGEELARAATTTAPAADAERIRLATGSCFDVNGDHAAVLAAAYAEIGPGRDRNGRAGDDTPTYNLWLGDQVYVDAPWLETTTTARMRSIIFDRYLRTWGITEPSSFQEALAATSNWFLPDDHEFWNGYPNPSWLTLFGHTARRFARQLWRLPRPAPPHPAAQGRWGSTAGEAYALFASDLDVERFTEDHSPEQLQTIETDHAVVVLADTRWHRTIRRFGPGAGFMKPDDHRRLLDLLEREERLVCLALSKPLIGHLPHRGVTQRKVEYGPEDYATPYTELWRAIDRRHRAGHPTVCLAGDVHHHAIRTANDGGLLEVVSSPLSMLAALDDDSSLTRLRTAWVSTRDRLRAAWRSTKSALRRGEERLRPGLRIDGDNAYPAFAPDGSWRAEVGEAPFEDGMEASGIAAVDIGVERGRPVLTVRYVLGQADERSGRRPMDRPVETRHVVEEFAWRPAGPRDPEGAAGWYKR